MIEALRPPAAMVGAFPPAGVQGGVVVILLFLLASLAAPLAAAAWTNVQVNVNNNYPEETAITINPANPDQIVAAAQGSGCYVYRSNDGGLTWAEGQLPDPYDLGDPSVVFDRFGRCYYAYIGSWSHSGIFVNHSTDQGATWTPAGTAVIEHTGSIPFEDKCYPVVDRTGGPGDGNVYIGWTQFDRYGSGDPADSSRILFAASTDGGLSFTPPVRVSDQGGSALDGDDTVEGAVPAVGPDGTAYLAWAGPRGIEFDRSTDAGLTWGEDQVISDQPGGWAFSIPGLYRANGLPTTKADFSPGPYRGRVYVLWTDWRHGDADVFLLYSDTQGASWGPRIRVNGDPVGNGAHQFFPWIDVDPVTGRVWVVYYDRREHPGSNATDVYLAVSTDGGDNFSEERISSSPFTPTPSTFFGDYIGIAAFGSRVRPFWMRLDGAQLTVWTALVDLDTTDTCEGLPGRLDLVVIPNPVRGGAWVEMCAPLTERVELGIYDVAGRRMGKVALGPGEKSSARWQVRDAEGRPLAAGIYLVRGEGAAGRMTVIR